MAASVNDCIVALNAIVFTGGNGTITDVQTADTLRHLTYLQTMLNRRHIDARQEQP